MLKKNWIAGTLGLILMLGGCASPSSKNTDKFVLPVIDSPQSIASQEMWHRKPTQGMGKLIWPLQVFPMKDSLYAADNTGRLVALDPLTGKIHWQHTYKAAFVAGPGGDDELILVGTHAGQLMAVSRLDGALRWSTQLSSVPMAKPSVQGDHIYVHTNDNRVVALHRQDGRMIWQFPYTSPALKLHGMSAVTPTTEGILVGASDGKLLALHPKNGTILWENIIAMPAGFSELQRLVDIDATPLVADNHVFVATYQGKLASVHLETGQTLWSREKSVYHPMAIQDGRLYVTDARGIIEAMDITTGAVLWKQEALKYRFPLGPVPVGHYVTVMDAEGYLYHLEPETGKLLNLKKVTGPISMTPVHQGEMLYIQSDSGEIHAIRF